MATVSTMRVPEDLVHIMESVLVRERIPVGVTYNDDFSRTYKFPEGITEEEIMKHVDETIHRFRGLFTS